MEKYDISQLTEFPRFESESSQSGVSTFLNKLWKFPLFNPSENADNGQNKGSEEDKQAAVRSEQLNNQHEEGKAETGRYAVELEGRSLPNVLRRISSLVALGSGGGTRYADTELARYWMPDDISRECYECATRFSTLRRRHHCRVCGQIFCSRCCSQRVPGHIFGCSGGLRVCNYCCNVVLSYLKENDQTGEISPDLRTLQESLQTKFPDNKEQTSKTRDNFVFSHEQEDRSEARNSPKETLHDVFKQLSYALPTQQHRYRLVSYNGVWRGCDILQWISDNTHYKTRAQASMICQSLLSTGYMECVTELPHFVDYALYRPVAVIARPDDDDDEEHDEQCEDRGRLVESVSSYCLALNLGDRSARLTRTLKAEKKSSSSDEEAPAVEQNEPIEERPICSGLSSLGAEHLRLLLLERLSGAGLGAGWLEVLLPLCQRAVAAIADNPLSNDMDIRNYVQVKKVPGGTPRDSTLINGVVMTKNVAHRGMPQQISKASILLLDCSIAYQRVEGKLTSLEPVLMQETEYLTRCAARITNLRPKVVLVSGTAGRIVQSALRGAGAALAVRVRERALRRTARCAAADMLTSVDARIGTPRLGACEHFYVQNFGSKTLMVLEGCAEPQLGCCILLRGASLQELIRVKKIVKFMLLACYNWKLEKSFLADIEVFLPEPGMKFDDDEITDDGKNENDLFSDEGKQNDDLFYSSSKERIDESQENKSVKSDDKDLSTEPENTKDNEDFKLNTKNLKEDANSVASVEDFKPKNPDNETDDPLQRKYSRKTENLSCGVPIRDFSDPLRSNISEEDDVFLPKEDTTFKADENNERWSTDDMILSMSPLVSVPPPLRGLPSPLLARRAPRPPPPPRVSTVLAPTEKHEYHPFVSMAIRSSADDPTFRAALASYRALGGRINTLKHKPWCPQYAPALVRRAAPRTPEERAAPPDPLAPENHQQLMLLLYSFSNKSCNVPDFCVNPWIVTMEMYGRHDISLGAFLHKYCFNEDYKCTANGCQIPMNQHVRRFVHGDVCITVTCNTIGHSSVDKLKEEQSKQVMFWSRCSICGAASRARRLRSASLSLSLASYLRSRVAAARALRSACAHAAHTHAHAFQCRLTTACFRYSKISTYDIILPPDLITINYDTKQMRDQLIGQLNELMLKGHETLSATGDECDKEYAAFKHHMDSLHVALTAPALQDSQTDVVQTLWTISDGVILGEKMLRDAQDKSNSNKTRVPDTPVEDKSDLDEYSTEENAGTTYAFPSDSSKDSDKEHTGEEDEEKGDKKTVRQILSQLLSNNQSANQSSMIMCSGLVPVVVQATQTGAVIAAALASTAYRKASVHFNSTQPETEESESASKDKTDGDKNKSSKSNEHVEVTLKDGLMCRVYYAAQFQALRHAIIAPRGKETECCCDDKRLCSIEEGFIRSLAQCVPWNARGGKSGSTFCKSKDDRYVLKEMTKPEWQQFLEFAPHYFNYMSTCRQNREPSLLARICGVYSLGGSSCGVLVMENVWYCGAAGRKFDLKGSRHRLAPPAAVLMDDNLLQLRWERPLYIRSHAASVLFGALERDTAFLASHLVMDYSLLLAAGEQTLVLGLIDYIRTFTWDKKLEHLVKKNLGSGQPTVVSPQQYRARLLAAARKYFLRCPGPWDLLCRPADS